MEGFVHVAAWSAWSPGLESADDWRAWALGEKELRAVAENPPLSHVDALFKRRLSQLTRMTVHVGHEALAGMPPMRLAFSSVWGEIGQQHKITDRLISENEVAPANFSLSVFNTPVAALSITEKNVEGYIASYPGKDAFRLAFLESAAAVLSGAETRRLLIVADELLPEEYAELEGANPPPYALALVVSSEPSPTSTRVPADLAALPWWGKAPVPGETAAPDALRFLSREILGIVRS